MFFALDSNNNRIGADKASKGHEYSCPCCNEEVILCKGSIKRHYFKHKSYSDCVAYNNDMCDWHIRMQEYFSEKYREVVFKDSSGVHRADVCIGNYIFEFQHSYISVEDFNERSMYYINKGYKVIWVFDTNTKFERYEISETENDYYIVKRPLGLWRKMLKHPSICICFSLHFDDSADEAEDMVIKVCWSNKDYNVVKLASEWVSLCDNFDKGYFFKLSESVKQSMKPRYRLVYEGIKGHKISEYFCLSTGTWRDNCRHCTSCLNVNNYYNGTVYRCKEPYKRNINERYTAPEYDHDEVYG